MFHNLSQCKRTDISTPCIVGIAHQNEKCKICSISEAGKKVKQCLVSKAVKEELEERVAVFDGGTSIFGMEKKDKINWLTFSLIQTTFRLDVVMRIDILQEYTVNDEVKLCRKSL